MAHLTESEIESAALAWLEALDYTILSGPEIAPGEAAAEPACVPHADRREDYEQVILESCLRQALQRLNPQVPADALIAGELASKARRELVWSQNLVLLGDFNIFSPQDPTLAKLEEKGFLTNAWLVYTNHALDEFL